jgi:hypothetical protein
MKKLITALTLTTLASTAFAGTSVDLVLKGVIAPILELSLAADPNAQNLPLDQSPSNLKVGTLTEKSNYAQGYKIKAKSTNGGKLVNGSDQNISISYSMTYDNSGISLSTSPSQIYTTANLKGTFTKDLKISYSVPANPAAGTYTDTVQFTIEAN